ncbi:hypothetical protein C4097_03745 [Clostridioides difficile]|uniref:hypothetical protein n=1 Tax=Bacillota TaxID=1239 RepID=UPI001C29ECC3|nr:MULTISPECIES: hypothetical protein [Bacillota]MDB3083671.1 hypothetical protein [Clostridioides difficile]MBZ6007571.1 hypothetical protein [Paraclostridium bifermentans]MDU0296615.1 hypothetical protein [Paraclostridium sp. MRS3W1]UOW69754.1 hypothetical protein MTR78_17590 [Paraclostridium bifermentans]GJG92711.1 hypothetical protein EFL1_28510 [Enterococcus faecium]
MSYIYSVLITTKIKNPILYKKIIDADYNLDEIITHFDLLDFSSFNEYVCGWHKKPLQEVIDPVFKMYLDLNLSKLENISDFYSNDFIVGLKNNDGNFISDSRFDLSLLFRNKELNINDKLEFIDGF